MGCLNHLLSQCSNLVEMPFVIKCWQHENSDEITVTTSNGLLKAHGSWAWYDLDMKKISSIALLCFIIFVSGAFVIKPGTAHAAFEWPQSIVMFLSRIGIIRAQNPISVKVPVPNNDLNINSSSTPINIPVKRNASRAKESAPIKIEAENYNLGTIPVRAIVANIDETGNRYGSSGMKFTQSKIAEVDQALQRLNAFVGQSSYGKTRLQWTTSGIYELGSGVCNHDAWSDKTNDLIQRALQIADSQAPIADYSYYLIVHPQPDCPDGALWSFEGYGQFKAYTLNGRTVHLRGTRISDLSDDYLFHEFGHSLGYQPNTGMGHPDYWNCPVTTINSETRIALSDSCQRIYDWNNGNVPVFTIMSAKRGILSDYNAPQKEVIGWLNGANIVTTTAGKYVLSPLEQGGSNPEALKIPITGTDYVVYVSFRQPIGYTYPDAPASKPNGVILDVSESNNISVNHFLVTNNTNMDAPLQIGVPYRVGTNGPVITLTGVSNNLASVTIFSDAVIPSDPDPVQSKAKEFIQAMVNKAGVSHQIASSSRQIAFPRVNGDSGPSNRKTLNGYGFSFKESPTAYNDYMTSVIGPTPAWLASERQMGYINDSIVCLQTDGSSGDMYLPARSSEIFCADLN